MTKANQPSELEYARFHGVAIDHKAINPADYVPREFIAAGAEEKDLDFEAARVSVSSSTNERVSINKGGAEFLSSIIQLSSPTNEITSDWKSLLPSRNQMKDIRQELPILKTDNEHDMFLFREEVSLDKLILDLPLENVSDDNDEGVVFPSYCAELPTEIQDRVVQEKMSCTMDGIRFLQEVKDYAKKPIGGTLGPIPTREHSALSKESYHELLPRSFVDGKNGTEVATEGFQVPEKVNAGDSIQRDHGDPDINSFRDELVAKRNIIDVSAPNASMLPGQFSAPGCLYNFMSIRGRTSPQKIDIRPHFSGLQPGADANFKMGNKSQGHDYISKPQTPQKSPTVEIELLLTPDIPSNSALVTLFISNSLLQTNRPLIYSLETLPEPPLLVFRDHTLLSSPPNPGLGREGHSPNLFHSTNKKSIEKNEKWSDADITLSSTAGVILTTSQDTTQLYLPGHSPSIPKVEVEVNSPLRERIYRTCMKYEQLYVLICHHIPESPGIRPVISIDCKTSGSLQALDIFCNSLKKFSSVTTSIVPSSAEPLTKWIMSLASKHYIPAPWSGLSTGSHHNPSCTNHPVRSCVPSEDSTPDEHSLQRIGLNCYAAWIIISGHLLSPDKQSQPAKTMDPIPPMEDASVSAQSHRTYDAAMRLRMSERWNTLAPVLGENILSRVERMLE